MERKTLIWSLLAFWVLAMGWSAWAAMAMTPTGDGLVRGFNKIAHFGLGQIVAGLCGILLVIAGWRAESSALRWATRAPLAVSLALVLALGLLIQRDRSKARDTSPQPDRPVTAPAEG